ncbi:hypothetical protein AA14337_3150 [Acetobacter malorum DSM 14337]|uniref:Uncharacterized protein n=1 Tax=Acetobacter malorum DSM 14337 TaxID=1307910 RepID=A0ABQ0PZY3_9PROT|nr:hypothetical protein [Acetobacter malorum]KXV05727.1 hypothetical protein AD930_11390 [Acetobacter malorum]GBQ85737.1 hypothetical protein AA14337_3150 [Acetobacter malorum DSM 14337]
MKFKDLDQNLQSLARKIKRDYSWLTINQCAEVIARTALDADPVSICLQIGPKNGLAVCGKKHDIDPATYESEKEELISALDEVAETLVASGVFRADADIHTQRLFLFCRNFFDWQTEAHAAIEEIGTGDNVVHIRKGNYWQAPQNAFKIISELYALSVDKPDMNGDSISQRFNILTLSFIEKNPDEGFFPVFLAVGDKIS